MAAPLRKKNTLEQTGFALTTRGIKYCEKFFSFEDVIETRAVRQVLEQRTVLVNSTFHYSISIVMITKSGEMLQVTEQPTVFSDSKLSKVEYIEDLFKEISRKTWDTRLKKYINQVNEKGFFEYDNWRFYTNQKVIQDLKSDKVYPIETTELVKQPHSILVQEKNMGIGMKLMKSFVGKPQQITTMTDPDIFFFILRHYFGLVWSK